MLIAILEFGMYIELRKKFVFLLLVDVIGVCVALTIDPYINSSLSCAHSNKITKGTVMTIIILSLLRMDAQP